jgi:hypothetical protein
MAKRGRRSPPTTPPAKEKPANPGLPDPKTVLYERSLVSPKGRRYRIITTTEKDPYDPKDHGEGRKRHH